MKALSPIRPNPKSEERNEDSINKVLFDSIFRDVFVLLDDFAMEVFNNDNNSSALRSAILRGLIQYQDGKITGKVSAKISREVKALGGTFDKRTKTWSLPKDIAPVSIITAAVSANQKFQVLHEKILEVLLPEKALQVVEKSNFAPDYESTLNNLEAQFKKSVSPIGIKPQMSEDLVKTMAAEYSNNMKLYIKNWTTPQILKLREQVQENAFNGARAEKLMKVISKEYGVSQRKAKFLAKQETKLITSTYNQERYKSAGITKFRWSTSNDGRVRGEHKHLQGKIFRWDEAVIDEHGNTGNPGDAFGCRCIAIPIVD